jgi:hypothetical protein
MKKSVVLLALLLCACSHVRYATAYCVGRDQALPKEPERVGGKLTGQAQDDYKIVAASAVELRAWGQGLNQILEGCREPSR